MRVLPALILAAGFVVAAIFIYKAASTGAASADRAAEEASRFREGLSSSPLGKYLIGSTALAGAK